MAWSDFVKFLVFIYSERQKIFDVHIKRLKNIPQREYNVIYVLIMVLPKVIEKVVYEGGEDVKIPHDSVMSELQHIAKQMDTDDENLAMALSIYLLGFSSYSGFAKVVENVVEVNDNALRRIYEYAKHFEEEDDSIIQ